MIEERREAERISPSVWVEEPVEAEGEVESAYIPTPVRLSATVEECPDCTAQVEPVPSL